MRWGALILVGAFLGLLGGCGSGHPRRDNVLTEVEALEGHFEAAMKELRAHPQIAHRDGGLDAREKAIIDAPEATIREAQAAIGQCGTTRRLECAHRKEAEEDVAELENKSPRNEEPNSPSMTAASIQLVARAEKIRGEVEAVPRDSALHRRLVDRADRLQLTCERSFGIVECDRRAMLERITTELPALGQPADSG